MLRNPEDSFTYISWEVGNARQDEPSVPGLYLLGGSSARESIVGGENPFRRRSARPAAPTSITYDLRSINQNFAESLSVVDSAPDTPRLSWGSTSAASRRPGSRSAVVEGREFLLDSDAVHEGSFSSSRGCRYTIPGRVGRHWMREHRRAALLEGDPPSTRRTGRRDAALQTA